MSGHEPLSRLVTHPRSLHSIGGDTGRVIRKMRGDCTAVTDKLNTTNRASSSPVEMEALLWKHPIRAHE